MTKADQIQIEQMMALGELLIKEATILKNGQSRKAGPRKGRYEAERKRVMADIIKNATRRKGKVLNG